MSHSLNQSELSLEEQRGDLVNSPSQFIDKNQPNYHLANCEDMGEINKDNRSSYWDQFK